MNLQENIQRIKEMIFLNENPPEKGNSERQKFTCKDCKNYEYKMYMVNNNIWDKYGAGEGTLCIPCLEKRMGRKLKKEDFSQYLNAKANIYNPLVQQIIKGK
jgi:hypothetical protein